MTENVFYLTIEGFIAKALTSSTPGLGAEPVIICDSSQRGVLDTTPALRGCGIKRGMPLWQARLMAPKALIQRVDETALISYHTRFLYTCYQFFPLVEPDERGIQHLVLGKQVGRVYLKGNRVTEDFIEQISIYGYGVSLGVATHKLSARLASLTLCAGNPFASISIVTFNGVNVKIKRVLEIKGFLGTFTLEALRPFISEKLVNRLRTAGLNRIKQIQDTPFTYLTAIIGKKAWLIYLLANGMDHNPVIPSFPPHELQIDSEVHRPQDMNLIMENLANKAWFHLQRLNQTCSAIALEILTVKGRIRREKQLLKVVSPTLIKTVLHTLLKGFPYEVLENAIRAIVIFKDLRGVNLLQPTLWDSPPFLKANIDELIHNLTQKFGPKALQRGLFKDADTDWRSRRLAMWDPWRCRN